MKLGYHTRKFSEKVRAMNDTNSKSLSLTAEEARNLHTDIFDLLAQIAELTEKADEPDVVTIRSDGGNF